MPKRSTDKRSMLPEGLSKRSAALWEEVCAEWDLRRNHYVLLEVALRALDRMDQARAEIKKRGLLVTTRSGYTRANPAIMVERDARNGFLNSWKSLGFDLEPPKDVGRPPG